METESTGATETTETKFSLSPVDFGLRLVPTLANFLSDPDFSGRVSCTPTLDIDDIEPKDASLFTELDYTANYYC
ncbi:unnamed protein product [Clonostachys rosea f. rosea IK726]|uniref:Uncharacterized protein n=1 Tax=Clonostachys rosea f. rosea IK726 TaxID=1349383 RepID=A0ACA9TYD4_BIOOC|nr:unnamed protein product [Clonostachys rosea f. rosea IK726]